MLWVKNRAKMTNSWVEFHFSFRALLLLFCVWCCKILYEYFFTFYFLHIFFFLLFCVPMPMEFNNIILMIFAFLNILFFWCVLAACVVCIWGMLNWMMKKWAIEIQVLDGDFFLYIEWTYLNIFLCRLTIFICVFLCFLFLF